MKHKSGSINYFFPKSHVPVYFLFDYLKDGLTWADFHSSYPWLKKKDIINVINKQKETYSASHASEKA